MVDFKKVDDAFFDVGPQRHFFAASPAKVEQGVQHIGAQVRVPPQLDVVQHRHAAKQRDVLETARQPQLGAFGRGHARDVAALEPDLPGRRLVETGNSIEQRGLAGAVRADDRGDGTRRHAKAHAGQRLDPAEGQGHPIHLQQRRLLGLIHHLSPRFFYREVLAA
ncbi:hypothetical protein D3C72_1637690 [compost metagenome]